MTKEQREFTINFIRDLNEAGVIGRQVTGREAVAVFEAAAIAWERELAKA